MSAHSVWSFEAIGTAWTIETPAPLPHHTRAEVDAIIAGFEREWSRFRDDSVVSALAVNGGTVPLPADAAAMLDLYDEVDAATRGAVNPLIGDSLARLGYDARYSFAGGAPEPAPLDWRGRLRWSGDRLELDVPATIDVGALGKGRLVDLVAANLIASGVDVFVVDASGDLLARGAAERIALEHPYDRTRAIGVIDLADGALCASAITRRAWGQGLHHVLDARTGVPVTAYAATWALAADAMHADALATALFFDGGAELAAAWGVQWVRMRTDGRVEWSPASTAELFS
ncbi:FAD:protein FMN transferase [Microbacterium sp. P04]|uniref:FAD:protein FMN transferase n=1 Tax=Microbacterium sp. P04 TaxID=3366947 RepID=UPI003745486A